MPDNAAQQLVDQWLTYGAIGGTIAAASVSYRMVSDLIFSNGIALFGRSKYATPSDGKKSGLAYSLRPRPDCILLGRTAGFMGFFRRYVCLPKLPSVEHIILYAKTGSGKGVAYVIANCFNYADSLVVLDLKNENYDATAAHRANVLDQEVYRFSPLDKAGETHRWNPLGGIDVSTPGYMTKLQKRAFSVFPEVSSTNGSQKFWVDKARSAFYGVSILICETPGMKLNMGTVLSYFVGSDGPKKLVEMIEARRAAGQPYSLKGVQLLSDYLDGTPEVVSGVRNQISGALGVWFNPQVCAATEHGDFDLRDLRRKRMTIYIGVMPDDLEQLGVLLRLFFLQLFDANNDATPKTDPTITHPCHVMMDEFTAIPIMPKIANAAGFARGFWLHFSFVVQSKNQIREAYKGNGASSLLENAGVEIVFGTNDEQLTKEVSERAGYDTVDNVSRSAPRFFSFFRAKEQNENTSQTKRALILPQEVAGLPNDELLMFRAGAPPFKLKRMRWFEDANFKHLEQPPPVLPIVTYEVERDDGSIKFKTDVAA